jgi:hypothetical protein
MKTRLVLRASFAALAFLGLSAFSAACSPEDTKVPDFTDKGQEVTPPDQSELAYPAGPYGLGKASVIPNLKFYGLHNPSEYPQDLSAVPDMEPIELAEFYNPTGTGTFRAESTYRPGELQPTILWIDISAQWCPPCQDESKTVLPADYTAYHDKGLEIMLELIEDTKGNDALPKNLWQWTTKYHTAWPAVIDPTRQVDSFFVQSAYPTNILIDTSTMTIVQVVAGEPIEGTAGDTFYPTIKKYLKQ